MSEDLRLVLDTQRRRLEALDSRLDSLLAGDPGSAMAVESTSGDLDEIVVRSARLRSERGWNELLPPPAIDSTRLRWERDDYIAAGLAGAVGFAATWYDAQIDAWVRDRLKLLSGTDLIRRWEAEAKLPVIDFARQGYGGPNHRVRGSGHDLLRVVAALRQLQTGAFEGVRWIGGEPVHEVIPCGPPIGSVGEALILWLKHMVTDVITDRSLPLPGWTWLNELPWPEAQTFARAVYMGDRRGEVPGLTLRSGVLATLPVLSTEVIVRAHVHGRAYRQRGTTRLTRAELGLRDELLLAAHGVTGAGSLGRTLTTAFVAARGPVALRHLNVGVLLRIGTLGWKVLREHDDDIPTWASLAERLEKPWDLTLAGEVERAFRDGV